MAADEDKPKATKPGDERRTGRDRRQRPTVTIDLKAEKVDDKSAAASASARAEAEAAAPTDAAGGARRAQPAAEPAAAKEETPRARSSAAAANSDGWRRIVFAGAVGGVIGLVAVIVLQATGLLPVPGGSAATQAIDEARSASDAAAALDRRVMALEAMTVDLPSVRSEIDGIAEDVSALEKSTALFAPTTDVEAISESLARLREELKGAPPAAGERELAALATRVGRLEARPPAAGGSDGGAAAAVLAGRVDDAEASLAGLVGRVDAIEEKIAALTAVSSGETAARVVAVTSLRRAAAGGEPFAADLDMVAALGVVGDDFAALRAFAVAGVATPAELAAQFPAVADAILSATASVDPNAGFWDKLIGNMRGLVSIRPAGPLAGDDPPAIVSRMQVAVAGGDLAAALAERESLPPAGKDASAAWAERAADRVTVDRLIANIVDSAIARSE